MTTPDIAAAMAAGMDTENRRRELAAQTPGYGAAVQLPDNPVGPNVGKSGLLDAVGEGHSVTPDVSPSVHKSYGPDRPEYADSLVGGVDYGPVGVETALRAAGERVFAAQDAPSRGDIVAISPAPAKRSLWRRLFSRR